MISPKRGLCIVYILLCLIAVFINVRFFEGVVMDGCKYSKSWLIAIIKLRLIINFLAKTTKYIFSGVGPG